MFKRNVFFFAWIILTGLHTATAQLVYKNYVRDSKNSVTEFLSGSGTWKVPIWVNNVEVLVVGGGGSGRTGGAWSGPGGGPGGLWYTNSYPVIGPSENCCSAHWQGLSMT